jgi:hypothetical protein
MGVLRYKKSTGAPNRDRVRRQTVVLVVDVVRVEPAEEFLGPPQRVSVLLQRRR